MHTLNYVSREIKRSLALRGFLGTGRLIIKKAISLVINIYRSHRNYDDCHKNIEDQFDKKYGVDTAGIIGIGELDVSSANYVYGKRYQPIHVLDFTDNLVKLRLRFEDYVFIDYGSGKGRAVLLASMLPFNQVIGIEFSKELNFTASNNLSQFPREMIKSKNIELLCMDAAEYLPPNDFPLILFFYNPFGHPIMSKVANNIVESYEINPRRIIVIYYNPEFDEIWDKVSFLNKITDTGGLSIYDSEKNEYMK